MLRSHLLTSIFLLFSRSTSTEYYRIRRRHVAGSKPQVEIYTQPDPTSAEISQRFVLGCDGRRESRDVGTDYRFNIYQCHKDTQADGGDELAQLELLSFRNKNRPSVDRSEQAGRIRVS